MLPVCALNLNALFFFCDYKEKSLYKRFFNLMNRYVFSWFVQSKSSNSSSRNTILMPIILNYLLIAFLLIGIAFALNRYEEYIRIKWFLFKSWLTKSIINY